MHSLLILIALNSILSIVICDHTIDLIYNLNNGINNSVGITRISLLNDTIKLLENSSQAMVTMNFIADTDFSIEQNFIVWSDRKSIYKRYTTEHSKPILLLDTTFVNALAFDWIYNLLYFVNADEIQMINITDTRMRYVVVRKINPDFCKIRVNPINSSIVWINQTDIFKSSYDGSNIELLAEQNELITALTIDIPFNIIYFVSLNQLIVMDFRGNNKRVCLQTNSLIGAQSVDIYGELFFWSKDNSIYAHNKNFNQTLSLTSVVTINDKIKYIKIMHSTRQPHTINHCLNNNCTHICVAQPNQSYRCVCPTLRYSRGDVCDEEENKYDDIEVIFSANKNILFTDLENFDSNQRNQSQTRYTFDDRIIEMDYLDVQNLLFWSKSNPNRTEEQLIVATIDKTLNNSLMLNETSVVLLKHKTNKIIGQLLLFAIDWIHELIYYMNDTSIIVSNINFFGLKYNMTVNSDDTKFILSLTVNPIGSLLFWSEIDKNTYIGVIIRSNQDFSDRKVLSHEEIITPLYLTIDYYSNRLFYYDYLKAVIASLDFDGHVYKIHFRVIVKSVSAIEIFGRYIYFNNYGQFWKIDIYDKTKVSFVNEFAHPIDSKLKIIHSSRKPINTIDRCIESDCEHLCLPINITHYKCVCAVFDDNIPEREYQDFCRERIGIVNRTENIFELGMRLNNLTITLIVIIVMALLSLTIIALFLIYFFVIKKRLKHDTNKSRGINVNDVIKDFDHETYDECDNHDNHYESPYYNSEENKYEATNYYDLEMEHNYDDFKQIPTYTQIYRNTLTNVNEKQYTEIVL